MANSTDLDQMPHSAASDLGLQFACLSQYLRLLQHSVLACVYYFYDITNLLL